MSLARRQFLFNSIKALVSISATGLLQSFSVHDLLPASEVQLRFTLFSDGHYGQKGTDYAAFHQNMVSWMNKEHKDRGLNFAIINGDLFHDDASVEPELKQQLGKLQMTWYPSHGNHDHMTEEAWQKAFGQPYNYVIEQEKTAFLFLNTADEKGQYIKADLEWTRQQLKALRKKEHLFVVMHITPFAWTKAGFAQPELVALFSAQKNLKAIFHGHDHDEDGCKTFEGKHYFFDGHTGGSWGVPYQGYRVVEVLRDGTIWLYQRNPSTDTVVNQNNIGR